MTDICTVCRFEKIVTDEGHESTCSEFCCGLSHKNKAPFIEFMASGKKEEGEYMLFPCASCGCVLEGEFVWNEVCLSCRDSWELRMMDVLLDDIAKADSIRALEALKVKAAALAERDMGITRYSVARFVTLVP